MSRIIFCLSSLALLVSAQGQDAKRTANTIVLDEAGAKNLRIETVDVEETDFEQSIFSLGRIEAIPAKRSGVSSRIPGRIVELMVAPGDAVEAGQAVARLESRQPGDPPPTITLKAAGGGLVTKGTVALGEPLEPGTTLLEITDMTEVWAIARVPEHEAGRMKPGTTAHIKVASLPDEKFDGELLRFGTEADRENGTIDAIFKLPNPNLTIRPGMRAEFSIVLGKREAVMSVPRAALQGEAASRFVYVKSSDPKLKYVYEKTPVVIGETNDRFGEILNGLLPGDTVVTKGAYSLSFAGTGSISLKEALDAAHGHEHAADGSELTEKKPGVAATGGEEGEHDHGSGAASPMWMYASGVLFLLLLISVATRKKGKTDEESSDNSNRKEAA